jgi:glycosyltransferase involved in cell wall biosynthesis
VVATRVGGIPEEVIDGETGLLAASGDAVALEQHLARLLGDPALRRKLGDRGRERFLAHFTFEKMFHNTMRVYQEAIEGRGVIPVRETAPPLRARPVEGTPNR